MIRTITQAAMALAICMVSFLFFKGITNIVNAFVVPLALFFGTTRLGIRTFLAVGSSLTLLLIIFFPIQAIFGVFYCLLAWLMKWLMPRKNLFALVLFYALTVSVCFWLAIVLTDWLFLTQMQTIMLQVMKQNIFLYAGMILFEGGLVGTAQYLLARAIHRRLIKV